MVTWDPPGAPPRAGLVISMVSKVSWGPALRLDEALAPTGDIWSLATLLDLCGSDCDDELCLSFDLCPTGLLREMSHLHAGWCEACVEALESQVYPVLTLI